MGRRLAWLLLPALFLALPCPSVYADKIVIRFSDGTERTIDITKPYDSVEVVREAPPAPAPRLESYVSIDFASANRGQTVVVKYLSTTKLTATAWLGIVPSDVPHGDGYENDRYDVLFVYLKGRASNTLKLVVPANIPAGEYEIRVFDSDQNGREVASSPPFYIE